MLKSLKKMTEDEAAVVMLGVILKGLKKMAKDEDAMTIIGAVISECIPGICPGCLCCGIGPFVGWILGAFLGFIGDMAVIPACLTGFTGAFAGCLDACIGSIAGLFNTLGSCTTVCLDACTGGIAGLFNTLGSSMAVCLDACTMPIEACCTVPIQCIEAFAGCCGIF